MPRIKRDAASTLDEQDRRVTALRAFALVKQQESAIRGRLSALAAERHQLEADLLELKRERNELIVATRNDIPLAAAAAVLDIHPDTARNIRNKEMCRQGMGVNR